MSKDNRKTQSAFECIACGFKENADYVGALNILAAGHAVLACGEKVLSDRSMKQEPIVQLLRQLSRGRSQQLYDWFLRSY